MFPVLDLTVADLVQLTQDDEGRVRVGTPDAPDWLGPGRVVPDGPSTRALTGELSLTDDLRLSAAPLGDNGVALRLEARRDTSAAAPGGYADVAVGVRFSPAERAAGAWPAGLTAFGHQYTEFGLPTHASEQLDRWFLLPFRPEVVLPLWLCAPDGRTLLLAPLDAFHEQVVTVPTRQRPDAGIAWGWHGDLAHVPAGFSSTLAVLAGDSPGQLLEQWAAMLDVVERLPVDHDRLGREVSYWTDNGAAYWYRTEPHPSGDPRSVTETLTDAVSSVEASGVPVGAVQLDSWFYPHEHTRPFDTDEWVVPPSGLVDWSPRQDILPDGLDPLRQQLGDRPFVAHCRHLSRASPLVERFECWVDDEYAHPVGSDYYEHLLDRAVSWGVETFEHDWLVECFFGVRGLREEPGRARAWQEGLDRAAAERELTLQWCMATPADVFQTATLRRVTSIRTSGDHGYLVGPGFLWAWFCYSNVLARAFGLAPFKDVFSSGGEHAEVEALLSALSTGPVGLGDAIGTTDPAVVSATCRPDGTIVRPDVPVAAVDACLRTHAVARAVPLVAECHTDHQAGRWVQVFCANTYRHEEPVEGMVDLGPAWPEGPTVALDLRTGIVTHPAEPWSAGLEPAEWTHHLLAPVLAGGVAVFGDVGKHAPVGRARLASIAEVDGGVEVVVAGSDETVTITGWSAHPLRATVDGRPTEIDQREGEQVTNGARWSVLVPAGSTLGISVPGG